MFAGPGSVLGSLTAVPAGAVTAHQLLTGWSGELEMKSHSCQTLLAHLNKQVNNTKNLNIHLTKLC